MSFINLTIPSYPYYTGAGNACYRPGDKHEKRNGLNFFDILLVESGTLFMSISGKEYQLSAHDVLILPPLASHSGSRACTEKTFFHWMHFSSKEAYEIADAPHSDRKTRSDTSSILSLPLHQHLSADAAQNTISVMKQLEVSMIDYFTNSTTHVKPIMNLCHQQELFLHLLDILSVQTAHAEVNDIAFAALQYLTTHYMEELSLALLAETLNCHPTHLIRCFKKQYGLPPNQMLIQIRLNRACHLLANPNLTVTSVAYAAGFSSASYFCKQFKKHFQHTPQEYREKMNASVSGFTQSAQNFLLGS